MYTTKKRGGRRWLPMRRGLLHGKARRARDTGARKQRATNKQRPGVELRRKGRKVTPGITMTASWEGGATKFEDETKLSPGERAKVQQWKITREN